MTNRKSPQVEFVMDELLPLIEVSRRPEYHVRTTTRFVQHVMDTAPFLRLPEFYRKRLLQILLRYASPKMGFAVYTSISRIAGDLSISEQAVRRTFRLAEQTGLIQRQHIWRWRSLTHKCRSHGVIYVRPEAFQDGPPTRRNGRYRTAKETVARQYLSAQKATEELFRSPEKTTAMNTMDEHYGSDLMNTMYETSPTGKEEHETLGSNEPRERDTRAREIQIPATLSSTFLVTSEASASLCSASVRSFLETREAVEARQASAGDICSRKRNDVSSYQLSINQEEYWDEEIEEEYHKFKMESDAYNTHNTIIMDVLDDLEQELVGRDMTEDELKEAYEAYICEKYEQLRECNINLERDKKIEQAVIRKTACEDNMWKTLAEEDMVAEKEEEETYAEQATELQRPAYFVQPLSEPPTRPEFREPVGSFMDEFEQFLVSGIPEEERRRQKFITLGEPEDSWLPDGIIYPEKEEPGWLPDGNTSVEKW